MLQILNYFPCGFFKNIKQIEEKSSCRYLYQSEVHLTRTRYFLSVFPCSLSSYSTKALIEVVVTH